MERLIWLVALNEARGISEIDDRDLWLTSCLEGVSGINKTNDQDVWLTNYPEWR
jgi:hypothetical protein